MAHAHAHAHAGIFVADDQMIVGVQKVSSTQQYSVESMLVEEIGYAPSFHETLQVSLDSVARLSKRHGLEVENIAIAVPGPVKMSGMRVNDKNLNLLRSEYGTFGHNIRRSELSNINIPEQVAEMSELKISGNVLVYHDAAAYAYGDFFLRRNEMCRDYGERREFNKLETHLLFLVDEGVGGSIIAAGMVAQGPSHPEIGHCIVKRHPHDIAFRAQCNVHRRLGCLESLVSLQAMRRRCWVSDKLVGDYEDWREDDDRLWLIAYYIAQAIANGVLFISPSRIVLCGRVVTCNQYLLPMIRGYVWEMLEPLGDPDGQYPGYSHQVDRPDFIDVVRSVHCGVFGAAMLAAGADHIAKVSGHKIPQTKLQ
ncbi:ROK family protein [Fluviibacterium sp. S390]|uniref:ROK family protein n=1 Tax=Fluviibacterium sp. S390 TaxID=3415139 RepID=UPI003C7B06A2